MVDSNRLANALSALGEGVGQYGKMQFEDEKFQQEKALQDRREQASQQFHATLQANMIASENARQDKQLAETAKDRALQRELTEKTRGDTIAMEQQRLASENQFRGQQLSIEQQRLGMAKQGQTQSRAASVIQARISGIERTITAANAQGEKAKNDLQNKQDFMLLDDDAKKKALDAIDQKTNALVNSQMAMRDRYNTALGKLTDVDLSGLDQGGYQSQDTSGSDMPQAPSGIPSSPAPTGQMPPKPPAISGGSPATAPAQNAYPEGARLIGPDGKQYVVKNGKPTPAGP